MHTLFLETIKINDAKVYNLPYHQARFTKTLASHYPKAKVPNLTKYLHALPPKGIYKCRILYADKIHSITYEPYTPKDISSFTLIEGDLDYSYKYADRTALDALKRDAATDEIIIHKKGLITDTSYSNLAFFDGTRWLTPRFALLKGTMRSRLLEERKIMEADISIHDLGHFSAMAMMNAMLGFKRLRGFTIYDTQGACLYPREP